MKSLIKEKYQQAQNQVIQGMVNNALDRAQHNINVSTNTIILAVLHDEFGWGHDRLMKFIGHTAKYQKAMSDRYGKDCDSLAMRRRLKEQCGIDVEQLVEDAAKDTERGKTVIDMGNVEAV